jgi:peptidoglycan hydrolase-like protein with peptidoglycan-binding domain
VAATKPIVTPNLIKQVQTNLRDAGYYKNQSIDGIWGPRTRSALQSFQKDHSLNVSGELDAPTLRAMNIVAPQTSDSTGNNTAATAAGRPIGQPRPLMGRTGKRCQKYLRLSFIITTDMLYIIDF